jgi:hypothetical protein
LSTKQKQLFLEKRKEDCQNNADDNTRCNGKVEAESLLFYHNIAGQLSNVRDFVAHQETYPHNDEDDAKNDEHFSDSRHYDSL